MKRDHESFRGYPRWLCQLLLSVKIVLLSVSFSFAQQNTDRVSVDMKNASLAEIFDEIKRQTKLSFMFSNDDLKHVGRKDYAVKNVTVDSAMRECLEGTGLEYELTNNVVVIRKAPVKAEKVQQITLMGTVRDQKGETLPGVSIVIKGTALGGATDIDGRYSLALPLTKDMVLVFSYVGMLTKEVVYDGQKTIDVTLEENVKEMEEVVVTGIFTRKAESYTGAARTVKAEDLAKVSNMNVLQALKNLDPSFQVIESNQFGSDPNRVPEIQMRGASSFTDMKDKYQTNPNQPLFIVDGFEQTIEKVMDMDMNRVESITTLKDATAKALYGSKGANGVVVIETKRPAIGKMTVSYIGSMDIQAPDLSSYNLCNAWQKLEVERLSGVYTSSTNHPVSQQRLDELYAGLNKEVERGVNTYWLSKPLRTGIGHKHSLNFEGGDEFIRYNINVSYNNVAGVMKGSNRETFGGGFTFSYRYKSLLFREQLSLLHNKADNSPYGSFSDYAKLNPYWRANNEDGTIREVLNPVEVAYGSNPVYNPLINKTLNTKDESKYTDITNNFYIEWSVFDDLKATGRFGFTSRTDESDIFYPRDHTMFRDIDITDDAYFERGQYTKGNGKMTTLTTDIALNYSKTWDKHVMFANAQWSLGETKSESVTFQAEGFANDKLDYITHAQQYLAGGKPSGSESLSRETSFLASVNYSYDSRYLFDGNYRANASSLFGADRRWGHFWSVGAGWNMHNEKFLNDIGWLQRLKLRISTGYTGSQNFNSYQAVSTYKYYSNEVYDNIIGSYLMSLANPDLQWQKTQDNNVGIDVSLFGRVDLTFDYYIKNTSNLLTPVTLPPSAGFSSYTENLGKSQNKGFELQVSVRAINDADKDLHLNVFGSLMHNTNKIKEINEALSSMNDDKDSDKDFNYDQSTKEKTTKPSVRYAEGQSMSAIWAVRSLGIDPGTGNELFLTKDGQLTYTWDANDQVVCGDELPKYTGTFGFNLDWKGFSVNTSFYFRLGGQMYNQTLVDKVENCDMTYNVDRRVYTGRWTTPGQKAEFKRVTDPNYFTRPTSRFVQDLSELQMTSLNVGYDFRNCKFMQNGIIERLKLSFYMNDVFRLSTVKTERGTDYPFARSFSFQLQATF
ncbi:MULTISPECIES: SusC/RagA family TonB-linked outer membrane protein [Butyricimonas]|uniref:SusC/RagA family TonB-linked outer membrane protein n=1 Tax=Butyricimonas TaxID=574697 RepID=UPI001D075103|nr:MULTISPECIES: SusC/RagA family TonB-linked outer membrane protein [Butyricimonas]MCB6972950.1 SusC/RagA family TonB-linked outer membrane protein [Butyricimonas synergistica]MCG4518486.1 SusC/RagA family TonB-linked outer membrane protein [Butyricimonas sp. DFI.6.44]